MRYYLLLSIFLYAVSYAQKLDTLNGKVLVLLEGNNDPAYIIDWQNLKVGHANIKIKETLGSYKVKTKVIRTITGYRLIRKRADLLLWKNGEKEIQLLLLPNADGGFRLKFSSNQLYNHWEIPFYRLQEEIIFGGGIQFSEYQEYNKKIINLTQENGIGRGGGSISKWTKLAKVVGENYATYCPSTYISTSQNRSFSWNSYAYSEVDFTTQRITFTILDNSVEFILGRDNAKNELNIITTQMAYKLPYWSLGTILGLQGGTNDVINKVEKVMKSGANIDAVWIQDWVGKRPTKYGSRLNWTWELDTLHYNNFESFKGQLLENDIKLLGYVNPFFAEKGKYITEGLERGFFIYESETDTPRLFDYGGMKGYMLNIYNEEAYGWMKGIIQTNLIDNGFSGWMADFAEWYPIGKDPEFILEDIKLHNEYPVMWTKLNYEVIQESGKELFFFNRSGGKETAQYSSMMWAGDQMVDYSEEDGLLSVFDAYLSSSHSGLPMIHSDAGGYTSVKKPIIKNYIRDTSLLKDWLFLEACTPVLRTHEGLLPDDNAQVYDENMTTFFSQITNLHEQLQPYFLTLIKEKNESGTAIFKEAASVNNAFIHHPQSIAIGNDLVILYISEKQDFVATGGWLFLHPNGETSEKLIPEMKIQVLVHPDSELINLFK